jgi:hypothetical protein
MNFSAVDLDLYINEHEGQGSIRSREKDTLEDMYTPVEYIHLVFGIYRSIPITTDTFRNPSWIIRH